MIKYNKANGKIYITIKETVSNENAILLEFKCEDTGIGMNREFLSHTFDMFKQENASSRTTFEGIGLGISITKNLID